MPKSVGTPNTGSELRQLICEKARNGQRLSQIALEVKRPLRTIQSIVKRNSERGHNEDLPRSGRPSKFTERDLRHLKLNVESNRRQSLADITNNINLALPSPVVKRTIGRFLKKHMNMTSRIAAKKPFLMDKHVHTRQGWAETHVGWNMLDWKAVIWTDEASVEIGRESRQCRVWHRPGERYKKACLVPTFKSGRQNLMIWGCIAFGKRGPLIQIPPNRRKGTDYVSLVLSGPLWEFYTELVEEKGAALVMEDGAPIHRSKVAKDFRVAHLIETLPHPAQSPDLNPIEHVWKRLKVGINKRPIRPKNLVELWVALKEEWEKVDVSFINDLVKSMPRRAQAVLDANGGSTKY